MDIKNIIVLFLILIVSIELLPYILTILFPDLCYGCSIVGKTHQKLNESIQLSKIAWVSYLILFLYLIYIASQLKNTILKITVIFFSLFFIYFPTLPLITLLNIILELIYKNPPFIHDYHSVFPASVEIEKHADKIIHEFKNYKNKPECIRKTNPAYKIELNSSPENCWRAIYLKKMGKIQDDEVPFFPITTELLKDEQIHNAIFSILDPGVEIPEHTGYYKGYLRYHLGVIIPEKTDKAYIMCGGEKYIWKQGEGILFDDLYLHYVKNPTQETRVVLYLDIKRKSTSFIMNTLNQIGLGLIKYSIMLNIFMKNQHTQRKIKENS
jgi:beta-hydroxylase